MVYGSILVAMERFKLSCFAAADFESAVYVDSTTSPEMERRKRFELSPTAWKAVMLTINTNTAYKNKAEIIEITIDKF